MACNLDRFDPTGPCLVLAPHLEYPTRNGGDILIDKKWSQFSEYVPFVDIVGRDTIKRYQNGKLTQSRQYKNISVSKTRAAISTLLKRSHYLLEKNLTKDFTQTARSYLSDPRYKMIVFSFLSTAAIVEEFPRTEGGLYVIETHNDELKWFRDLRTSSSNPLAKLTAYFSERWAGSFLSDNHSRFLFIHVSEADQKGYLRALPDHRSCVVPIGVDLPDESFLREDPMAGEKTRLIFVGSLSVTMNFDALKVFRDTFYPLLRERLDGSLEVLVVGSNPSKRVIKLCTDVGWKLHPDVSDEELRRLYRMATFSILPFAYTTGAKLKLLKTLAHGVPYLATSALRDQADSVVYPSLVSNDAKEWLARVEDVRSKGITSGERLAQVELARQSSWRAVTERMYQMLVSD